MSVRFGVSPIAWINDDLPELGGDTPVETVLRDAHALGFEGIELGGKFSRDVVQLGTQLGVVFDNAVMHDGDTQGAVRMRVVFCRCSVRRPARMADADNALEARLAHPRVEIVELARRPQAPEVMILEQRHAG